MKFRFIFLIFGVLLFSSVAKTVIAGNELQYWSLYVFKFYNEEKISAELLTEVKMYENVREIGLYLFSPRVKYKFNANINLQLNTTYLKGLNKSGDYITQYRFEPEINPNFIICAAYKIDLRNRIEFRHIERKDWDNTRYRGRIRFTAPLKDAGIFQSLFFATEYFYDFALHKHLDQWTIPCGLNIGVARYLQLQLFYMIQRQKGSNQWFSNHIIGSMLSVKL